MDKSEKRGFIHSVKVPRIYKTASVIVKKVVEDGSSLKDLVYSSNHKNIKGVYALVVETIKHGKELDSLLSRTKLLENEVRLQPWLAKILLTELLFGKKELKGWSKPVLTVLSYREKLENLLTAEKVSCEKNKLVVKKPKYVRVNTLQCTPDEIIKSFRKDGWCYLVPPTEYSEYLNLISNLDDNSFTRDFHIKEILVFPSYMQFYQDELYQNGSILLQDKASCLPAFLLKPKPESVALDMCAAPGMKTTHLSAIMKNKGQIYATEIKSDRFKVLTDIVQSAGCTNVTPINIDALKLPKIGEEDENFAWTKDVEYILVDPSCSGSGIVERINVFEGEKIHDIRLNKLCGFQFKLLMHALTNFPKVKRIVYSTCSIHTQENEKVVEDALKKLNSLNVDEKQSSKPQFRLVEPLKGTWTRRGCKHFEHSKNYIFADPRKDLTNGFFVAVFERVENESEELNQKYDDAVPAKKKKDKKERRKSENNYESLMTNVESEENQERKHKKKKKERNPDEVTDANQEECKESSRSKKKKKRKKSENGDVTSENADEQQGEALDDVITVKKKKKKSKDS